MTHIHPQGAATVQVNCKRCKQPFMARVADRARGWGKFCSKSCKAIKQTQRTGRGAPHFDEHLQGGLSDWERYARTIHPFSPEAFEQ